MAAEKPFRLTKRCRFCLRMPKANLNRKKSKTRFENKRTGSVKVLFVDNPVPQRATLRWRGRRLVLSLELLYHSFGELGPTSLEVIVSNIKLWIWRGLQILLGRRKWGLCLGCGAKYWFIEKDPKSCKSCRGKVIQCFRCGEVFARTPQARDMHDRICLGHPWRETERQRDELLNLEKEWGNQWQDR